MSSITQVAAKAKTNAGTSAARTIRGEDLVPAILYGGKESPEMLALEPRQLHKELHSAGFFSKLFEISIDGKKGQLALARDVQFHPVTDQPIHVDFMRVSKDKKVVVFVPVEYINEDKAPGIKRGGILNIISHQLELSCNVTDIPEKLTIDLTGLEINHSIHIDSLNLPKGATAVHPERDYTLATIVPPVTDDASETAEATPAS